MRHPLALRSAAFAVFLPIALAAPSPVRAQAPVTQQSAVTVPDSPPGRALKAWLEAFNTGDSARMAAYYQKYEPQKTVQSQLPFRTSTGGFDLVRIENSTASTIEYVVKERVGPRHAFGVLSVAPSQPERVESFTLLAIAPGGSAADFKIDATARARVIEGAIAKLDESYVFPDVAKKMGDAVRARSKRGEYDAVTNGITFASLLTTHLQDVSHDKHLRVNFSPSVIPTAPPTRNPADSSRMRRQMESMNCAFVKVEVLPGNVGYLKFNAFMDPAFCGPTASAAMNFLANSDALIVDLRENGGGDPAMVSYISSYLFSQRTHLNDLWTRRTDATQEYWTNVDVAGKKLPDDKPVFVLTSNRTFSGGEEFTYNLKNLKRATIVGETTGGGAHPVSGHRVDDHFSIGVPFARAINPISKTNWEGVGVEPDVKVPAADALTTAQKLIADKRVRP